MEPFEYRRARDVAEAFRLVDVADGAGTWLAGGTDVVPMLKDGVLSTGRLVDIKRLRNLDRQIRLAGDDIVIGALATLADVARDDTLARRASLLGQAARAAASPQIRATATVAGNLLQRPRCWYFRHPDFHCWLEGGASCPALEGRNDRHAIFPGGDASPCCAVHPSDLAPCLVALDARVVLMDAEGRESELAVQELFRWPTPDHRRETVLEGELITGIRLPALPPGARTGFRKAMARASWSFALAAVAARLDMQAGRIIDARVVLGGVAGLPWRARQAESVLRDGQPSEALFRRAAERAVADARPLSHNAYKVPLTRGLVVRTLLDTAGV